MKNYPNQKNVLYHETEALLSSTMVNTNPKSKIPRSVPESNISSTAKPLWKIPPRYSLDDNGGGYEGL
jgi:hypothetical protein